MATLTRPTGSCKLAFAPHALDDALASGAALLTIRSNGSSTDYWLQQLCRADGRVEGYRLTQINDRSKVYDIDLSFGGWEHAECDCPDFVFRRRNTGCHCKHVYAVRAALATHGVA